MAVLITFILQNAQPTTVHFLFWSLPEIPKLVLILASMLVGAVIALIIVWDVRSRHTAGKNPMSSFSPGGSHGQE